MDRRDQELLDKQLRTVAPAHRRDGLMILAIVAVFFSGMVLGGTLFSEQSKPSLLAANTTTTGMAAISGGPHLAR